MASSLRGLLVVGLSLFLLNCSREVKQVSKIALSFSNQVEDAQGKLSSQSVGTEEIVHLVINVRGPGISKPIKVDWDAHCNGPGCNGEMKTPPPYFELDVPTGSKRLIQVMVVTQDSALNKLNFKYGDVEKDLSSGFNEVNIITAALGQSSTGETKVVGQYIEAGGITRTGRIRAEVQPPNLARPPMHILTEQVFGGWVKLMFLDGVNFKYYLEPSNTQIFGNSSITAGDFSPAPSRIHVEMPGQYFRSFGDSGSPGYERGSYNRIVAGFFGPGSSGKFACYDATMTNSPSADIDGLFLNDDSSTPIRWWGSPASPPTNTVHPSGGGLALSNANCTGGTDYSQKLEFKNSFLTSGNDYMGGFNGPFKLIEDSYGFQGMDSTYDGASDTLDVEWFYLPGVFAGDRPISGVEIFVKDPRFPPMATGVYGYGYSEEAPCDQQLLAQGYVRNSTITGSSTTTFSLGGVTDLTQTEIGVCPYRQEFGFREYFTAHLKTQNSYSGGGGGGGMVQATVSFVDGDFIAFAPTEVNQTDFVLIGVVNNTGSPQLLSNFTLTGTASMTWNGGTFPGTGGNCSVATPLPSGSTCQVSVRYSPTNENLVQGNLSFQYDLAGTQTTVNSIIAGSGYYTTGASLTYFPIPLADFGPTPTSTTAVTTMLIKNWGVAPATSVTGVNPGAPFSYAGGSFPGSGGGNCTSTIAPGAECYITLAFTPSAVGPISNPVNISYFDGGTPKTLYGIARGQGVEIGFTPNYIKFSSVTPNASVQKTVVLTNHSANPMTNLNLTPGLTTPFSVGGMSTCPLGGTASDVLASNASCTILINYNAPSSGSSFTDIFLNYKALGQNQQLYAHVDADVLSVGTPLTTNDFTVDFGPIAPTSFVERDISIINPNATMPILLESISIPGGTDFSLPGGAPGPVCNFAGGYSIPANGSCNFRVRYTPVANGNQNTSVYVYYQNGGSNLIAFNLSGAKGPNLGLAQTVHFNSMALMPWTAGSCNEAILELQDANGDPVSTSGTIGVDFTYTAGNGRFYRNIFDCSSQANAINSATTVLFSTNESQKKLYFRSQTPAQTRFEFSGGALSDVLRYCIDVGGSTGCSSPFVPVFAGYPNPLDFIKATNTAIEDRLQTPATCDSGTAYDANVRCFSSGLHRKYITGFTSCANLTLEDSERAFNWKCVIESGPVAVFYTDGFKPHKGLGHLISPMPNLAWKPISLTLKQSSTIVEISRPEPWSTQNIYEAPSNELVTDSNATFQDSDRFQIVSHSRYSSGYNLDANRLGMIVLPGATLTWNGRSTANCNSATAESLSGPDTWCLLSVGYNKGMWIEGSFDGAGMSSPTVFFAGGSHSLFTNMRVFNNTASGTGAALKIKSSVRILVDGATFSHTNMGLTLQSASSVIAQNIFGGDSANGILMYLTGSSYNKFFNTKSVNYYSHLLADGGSSFNLFNKTAIFNAQQPIDIQLSSNDNTLVETAVSGSVYDGIKIGGNNTKLINATVVNISSGSEDAIEVKGTNTILKNIYVDNAGYGINGDGTGKNALVVNLAVGSSLQNSAMSAVNSFGYSFDGSIRFVSAPSCYVANGGTGFDTGCFSLVDNGATLFPFRVAYPFGSTIFGKVANDSANSQEDGSGQIAYTSLVDWFNFQNFYRGWGRATGSVFPDLANRGICTSGTNCQLWDLRLMAGAYVNGGIRDNTFNGNGQNSIFTPAAACPAKLNGNVKTSAGIPDFLTHATEIVDDELGDNDGLCEAGEACISAPNFGAYQGSGDYKSNYCNFSAASGVSGVTMYAYPTNGE